MLITKSSPIEICCTEFMNGLTWNPPEKGEKWWGKWVTSNYQSSWNYVKNKSSFITIV